MVGEWMCPKRGAGHASKKMPPTPSWWDSVEQGQGVRLLGLDPEIQTALGQASLQALPGLGVLRAAYGMPLGVEQYAVAAPEGGQRADQVQTLGGALQLLAVLRQAQLHGPRQTLAHLLQSFLQQTQQALGMLLLQSSMQAGQLLAAQIHALLPGAAQAQFQLIQALALLGQPLPRVPQATAQGVQSQPLPLQADLHALLQLAMTALQLLQHGPGIGAEQLGGRRGGGGAYVGDEVADGYIGLVTDGADHRGAAGGHGPGDHFLVERPEILQRATAPGQDQGVEAGPIGPFQRLYYLRRRLAALDRRGADYQFDEGRAPAEHADDVAHRRAAGRGDDADPGRVRGQRALALGSEQALGLQPGLERLECLAQCAVAGRFYRIEDHLVVAASFIETDPAAGAYQQAVTQVHAHPGRILPEQGTAYLGAAVLEGEVQVAGGRAGQVRQFTLDPDRGEDFFEQPPGAGVELTDGQHLAFCAQLAEYGVIIVHVRMLAVRRRQLNA